MNVRPYKSSLIYMEEYIIVLIKIIHLKTTELS